MEYRAHFDSVKHLKENSESFFLKNVNVSIDHSCRLIKESLNDNNAGSFPIQIAYHQDITDGHTI